TRAATSTSPPRSGPTGFCFSVAEESETRAPLTTTATKKGSARGARRCGHDDASLSAEARNMDGRARAGSSVSPDAEWACRRRGAGPGPLARARRRQGTLLGHLSECPEPLSSAHAGLSRDAVGVARAPTRGPGTGPPGGRRQRHPDPQPPERRPDALA